MSRHLPLQILPFCCVITFVCLSYSSSTCYAQAWAREMFADLDHDFGTVPRGAKTEFEFKFTNKFKEDVHVSSVRTSCQCTLPRIGKGNLKTYQEGSIVAEFNTGAFVGARAAVVTVVFDRPYYAEVQLNVKGNIRSDIHPEPGEVQFGEVDEGNEKTTSVKISYTGAANWEIKDVRSANQHLTVLLDPKAKKAGRTEYNLQVRLKSDAPAGEIADEIILVTNEPQYNLITLPVRANVIPPLSMPISVELGTIKPGKAEKNRVFIKSKQPFKVEKIECEDDRFVFDLPAGEKTAHFIPFEFKTGDKVGAFRQKITVHTSLTDPSTASTTITGNVGE